MLRWTPAELHTHTFHSDGSQSLQELAQAAKQAGIDVLALTDHNTQSGLIDRERIEASTGLRIIAGMEWTTFYGHMVTIGLQQYVDWRQVGQGDIEKGIHLVHEAGGIAGIAHPFRIGSPICTGCYWEYPIHDWSKVDYIEVWSTLMPFMKQDSQRAFALWTDLLNEGHRLAATSGRDWHRTLPDDAPAAITYIGLDAIWKQKLEGVEQKLDQNAATEQRMHEQPQTNTPASIDHSEWVAAHDQAEQHSSIHRSDDHSYIEAIRNGRLSVTMGPLLDLYAVVHHHEVTSEQTVTEGIYSHSVLPESDHSACSIYQIGDVIHAGYQQLQLHIQLDRKIRHSHYELPSQKLRLVIMSDQGILAETKLDSEEPWQEWIIAVPAPTKWLRAELYGYFHEVCGMLAFTNAIYTDGMNTE